VAQASATTLLPFGDSNNASVLMIEGHTLAPGEAPPVPGWNIIDPGYFQTMSIPMLQGQPFKEGDTADTQRVAIIDQFLAKKYFPKGGAIGAKVRRGVEVDPKDPPYTIIGVVGSVKTADLAEQNPVGMVYFDYKQFTPRSMFLVAKAFNEDPQLGSEIRRAIQKIDPELPLFDVKTMPDRVSTSMLNRRGAMVVCLVFAGLALVLSAIGIYGVLAYTVTQRMREFGIRMALGAEARNVIGLVVGHGLKLAGIGLAIGIAGAYALTRLMTTMLYDVKPTDPTVFLLVAGALIVVAVVASFIPSVRAVRVKPAIALRYE
jgi:predicted permease